MKVKDLIKQLESIKNQNAEITLLGNVGHPEDRVHRQPHRVSPYGDHQAALATALLPLEAQEHRQVQHRHQPTVGAAMLDKGGRSGTVLDHGPEIGIGHRAHAAGPMALELVAMKKLECLGSGARRAGFPGEIAIRLEDAAPAPAPHERVG